MKELFKKAIPYSLQDIILKRVVTLTEEDKRNALLYKNIKADEALLERVNLKVSKHDTMHYGNGAHYLSVGLSAINCILKAIEDAKVKPISKILDMPCGFGRVLRFLKIVFPDATITGCDVNKGGVDFCAKKLHSIPHYSTDNLQKLSLPEKYDLIWCGSLVTHFFNESIN
jgi:hypothetical protein